MPLGVRVCKSGVAVIKIDIKDVRVDNMRLDKCSHCCTQAASKQQLTQSVRLAND
jgi:hypothetical protein